MKSSFKQVLSCKLVVADYVIFVAVNSLLYGDAGLSWDTDISDAGGDVPHDWHLICKGSKQGHILWRGGKPQIIYKMQSIVEWTPTKTVTARPIAG